MEIKINEKELLESAKEYANSRQNDPITSRYSDWVSAYMDGYKLAIKDYESIQYRLVVP